MMVGSMKEIAAAIKRMDGKMDGMSEGIISTNRKLDVLGNRMDAAEIDIANVKQNALAMRTELSAVKIKVENEKGAKSHATDIEARLDRMQEEMNTQIDYLKQITVYHQGMLESVVARFRGTHDIIIGL